MFYFNTKRRKFIASFFSLSLSFVLVVSCTTPRPTTLADILTLATALIEYVDTTEKLFYQNSSSVNTSYAELKENLSSGRFVVDSGFSNPTIKKMEDRHLDLSTKHKELDDSINQTNLAANKLFSTLETRAKQNTRIDLQEESLRSIQQTEKVFRDRIEIAEDNSSKLQESIQEYDNILNFLQVSTVTKASQKYLTKVDSVISQYQNLNQEVQVALREGRQVISNIAGVTAQNPETAVPTLTPNENISQQLPETPVPTPTPNENTSQQLPETPVPTPTPNENTSQQQVDRPVLGISAIGLTQARQKNKEGENFESLLLNLDNLNQGVLVAKVFENSSAADAGIKAGDVILTINGKVVNEVKEITVELQKFQVGTELSLVIYRNQENRELSVLLKADPTPTN